MIKKGSALPYYESAHSFASWGGSTLYEDLQFINYDTTTSCGGSQNIFRLNKAPDYSPRVIIDRATFNNVSRDAMLYMDSPDRGWANLDDCGNFPCTGPNNTYL